MKFAVHLRNLRTCNYREDCTGSHTITQTDVYAVDAATDQIKSEALQRIGDRTVVFIPKEEEPGAFEIREVQVGAESGGYTRVLAGLEVGQKVVTKGSFTLKTQMMKGELGDHDH